MSKEFRSGFVALVGRPNVGKSTILNNILEEKVAIISDKPQTTRNLIRGIYTTEELQIIFVDTPGIHKPQTKLGEYMNKQSLSSIHDVDIIFWIIDGTKDFGRGDEFVLAEIKKSKTPAFLIVNKIDLIRDKNRLMENILAFTKDYEFNEVYYVSGLTGENIPKLVNLYEYLEAGPMYFPKDQTSDNPEYFIISEIIREKTLQLTREEIPHSVAVAIEMITEDEQNPNLLNINAIIFVERASQKKIIIGANGSMIKNIGTLARKEIVMILGRKVFLELWVKVEKDWRNKQVKVEKMGYFTNNY